MLMTTEFACEFGYFFQPLQIIKLTKMKAGVLLVALFALSVISKPVDVIDVCNMTAEAVAGTELDRFSVIHFPRGRDMGCAEFVTLASAERDNITLCEYAKIEDGSSTWGWWSDFRWTHVLVKCKRMYSYCNAPFQPFPFRTIPEHHVQISHGTVEKPCYRLAMVYYTDTKHQ